eukprot:jgi/Mesen1/885/ME000115S00001
MAVTGSLEQELFGTDEQNNKYALSPLLVAVPTTEFQSHGGPRMPHERVAVGGRRSSPSIAQSGATQQQTKDTQMKSSEGGRGQKRALAPVATAALGAASGEVKDEETNVDSGSGGETGENNSSGGSGGKSHKKPRLIWTAELHSRFMNAVNHLGVKNAVPKTILQLMNVEGMTRENVASHLQKYRLYLKRLAGLPPNARLPPDVGPLYSYNPQMDLGPGIGMPMQSMHHSGPRMQGQSVPAMGQPYPSQAMAAHRSDMGMMLGHQPGLSTAMGMPLTGRMDHSTGYPGPPSTPISGGYGIPVGGPGAAFQQPMYGQSSVGHMQQPWQGMRGPGQGPSLGLPPMSGPGPPYFGQPDYSARNSAAPLGAPSYPSYLGELGAHAGDVGSLGRGGGVGASSSPGRDLGATMGMPGNGLEGGSHMNDHQVGSLESALQQGRQLNDSLPSWQDECPKQRWPDQGCEELSRNW